MPCQPPTQLSSKSEVPNLVGTRDRFCGRQFSTDGVEGWEGARGRVQGVMPAKLCSLTRQQFTSCCAVQFLTGYGPVRSEAWGLGTSALSDKGIAHWSTGAVGSLTSFQAQEFPNFYLIIGWYYRPNVCAAPTCICCSPKPQCGCIWSWGPLRN